jgi:hypothetical protein
MLKAGQILDIPTQRCLNHMFHNALKNNICVMIKNLTKMIKRVYEVSLTAILQKMNITKSKIKLSSKIFLSLNIEL